MAQDFAPISRQATTSLLVPTGCNNESEGPDNNLLLQMPNNFEAYQNQQDVSIRQDVSGYRQNWSNIQNQNVAENNFTMNILSPFFYDYPTFDPNLNNRDETKSISSKSLVDLDEEISNLSGEISKLNVQKS